MKRLTKEEVHAQKIAELGLDPTVLDLTSVEALAGAFRRAASFLCPCTTASLIRAVVRPLWGLSENLDEIKTLAEETLESMVAHGDILEQRNVDEEQGHGSATLLYAAPASFVSRQSGAAILLGIASDQLSALPDDLEARIEYTGQIRRLNPLPGEDLCRDLVQLGINELSYDRWLKTPPIMSPTQHLSHYDRLLDEVNPSRDIPGLYILDTQRPVRYYPGRWVEPRKQTGRFVGRRNQAYGADLWCYLELRNGVPERLIDLPAMRCRWRGCDVAWHLQMAIDAIQGNPQLFRVRSANGIRVLELFSPVPMWARRRWDAIGAPVPYSGCLFAYRFSQAEFEEELQFLRNKLWLHEMIRSER